jgi:hypothetical protein
MNQEKLDDLIKFVQDGGKVCPMPQKWNELWEILPNRERVGAGWKPSLPLILAAWWEATPEQKRQRLMTHITYAVEQGVFNEVDQYLRQLQPQDWAYGNGTDSWDERRSLNKK